MGALRPLAKTGTVVRVDAFGSKDMVLGCI